MATTISNGESGSSVRAKLNDIWAGLQLNEIDTSIADTAVDVFVYDTSKDSDGGAWRKRTQHTSWYNETLNTATRGSRREFPAVAVIVAESTQVTIYDGDDPDLPMWMVFNKNNSGIVNVGNMLHLYGTNSDRPFSGITAANGHFAVCEGGSAGVLYDLNFVADNCNWITENIHYGGLYRGSIAERNDGNGVTYFSNTSVTLPVIVARICNDVAMTVLPNAPIDAATGLPVPTIAVATDGGVSVIKDDGTVVDLTYTFSNNNSAFDIDVDETGRISWGSRKIESSGTYLLVETSIPSSDKTTAPDIIYTSKNISGGALRFNARSGPYITAKTANAVGSGDLGLTHLAENPDTPTEGMVAYTTSDYATGWMNGDIKLATLSDTDATNVTGSELVTNGTFDTDVSGWTASTGATVTHDTNRMKVAQGTSNDYVFAYQTIATVIGETYTASFDVIDDGSSTSSAALYIRTQPTGGNIVIGGSGFGTNSVTFTATTTTTYIAAGLGTSTDNVYVLFDNISVRLAEEDRSVNGNGLQVFGTVTKAPVATGADLVAYSGFSSSNYLEQPYNSDLDFGTGDFCVMGWGKINASAGTGVICSRTTDNVTGGAIELRKNSGLAQLRFNTGSTGYDDIMDTISDIPDNVWFFFAALRKDGIKKIYLNGAADNSGSDSSDVTNTTAPLFVGNRYDLAPEWAGSLALLRISGTAPSPEQIKKIYEDEKVLFQENAKAVLAGTSDAVTALAFDDSTNLLHVGSSYGRSVFQGLRRVSNTTTAVGTAISASNGLVVEE